MRLSLPRRPRSLIILTLAGLAIGPACAQTAPTRPLDLTLPPSALPAASASAPAAASALAPGVYFGDTSGRTATADTDDSSPDCDDARFNQPQVHGRVGVGVVAGGIDGNYEQGSVRLSQAFGSCDHPTGGVSISIGTSTGRFHRDH